MSDKRCARPFWPWTEPKSQRITHDSLLVTMKTFSVQIHNLHRCHGRFVSFIVMPRAGARVCLLDRIRGDDAEQSGHAGFQINFGNAPRGFGRDVIKVRRVATNNYAETDYRVELLRLRRFQRTEWKLKTTGHAIDRDCVVFDRKFTQCCARAVDQARHERVIPAAGDYRKPKITSIEWPAFVCW